ncbi:class I SAM-dependent methyltransferase [Streptomyces sp. NPDC001118]
MINTNNAMREDQTPEYWDARYSRGHGDVPVSAFEAQMFRVYVDPAPGMIALDAGCGTGAFASRLATWGLDVLAADFSSRAIANARQAHTHHDSLSFALHDFNADAIPPSLAPGSVDLVVCRMSLAYLDRARFIGDVRRWLTPEGILHITTPVTERAPAQMPYRGLGLDTINGLADGWWHCTRYDIEGQGAVTCIVLRAPMH